MAVATSTARILLLLVVLVFLTIQVIAEETGPKLNLDRKILQESFVKLINDNAEAGWKASMNPRFSNYTVGQFKHLLGVKPKAKGALKGIISAVTHEKGMKLPEEFDARKVWPQCRTIGDILDQGHCGSCWAFGAVEVLSDRFCIHHALNVSLSVNDLLACGDEYCGDCDGGDPVFAWVYLTNTGVVTAECDPYFDSTGCSHPGCTPAYPTPECVKKCQNGNMLWKDSKHFSSTAYGVDHDPYVIMAELYKNGPIEVSFTVYEDFAHYKSGVYRHITGDALGGHAVKLIGWGTTKAGEEYWLLANQWNRSWGEDGYFKMRRGTNECGIEDNPMAGLPQRRT